jgi:hypothetical protein
MRTNSARLGVTGRSWCYNGTNIGEGPLTAPPGTAFGFGLSLERPQSMRNLWHNVWASSWMMPGTPTQATTGFWKVVPGKPIAWTQPPDISGYDIRFGGFLGKNIFKSSWSKLQMLIRIY